MTCRHSTTKPHSTGTTPIDILTYRFKGQLVYVPVAPNYDEALSHARAAFPQLKDLRDASISLSMPGHAQRFVGISAPAWPKLIAHMARYQIIDVQVALTPERDVSVPNITITYADGEDMRETEPAPPYSGSDAVEDEKASHPRPRPLPATLQPNLRSWFIQKLHGGQ